MASFWIDTPEAYIGLEQESRKYHLHPWLREYISVLKPKKILDFGSGDGSLFLDFRYCYDRLCLYDHSPLMLTCAKRNFLHDARVEFLSVPQDMENDEFDVVVCSLVLMTVPSQHELEDVCSILSRACAPGGHCVVAVTHPCFRQYPFSTFSTEFVANPFHYMHEGIPFRVTLTDARKTQTVEFTDYHWSMSYTINLFLRYGFQLTTMVELPDQAMLENLENKLFPGYLVLDYIRPLQV